MRIAVLWSHRSGYIDACLAALGRHPTVERTLLAYREPDPGAPFELPPAPTHEAVVFQDRPRLDVLSPALTRFNPDAILVNGWQVPAYRAVARSWRRRVVTVLCMDNQWRGRPKQWLGVLTSRLYLDPLFELVYVPGERQCDFARRLGFAERQIFTGLYACDMDAFQAGIARSAGRRGRFLYVGRLSPEKGIEELLAAYRKYRGRAGADAWSLRIVGSGPMTRHVAGVPGIEHVGFVQPDLLPVEFTNSSALVTPSRTEPWGVVVHEGATAGLPLICTTVAGASVHLVSHGYNGITVPPSDVEALTTALEVVAGLPRHRLEEWGRRSAELAAQFTPELFASRLVDRLLGAVTRS